MTKHAKSPLTPALLSDRDVAALLAISRSSVWRQAAAGSIPSPVRIAGVTRWRRAEIEELIERATAEQRACGRGEP